MFCYSDDDHIVRRSGVMPKNLDPHVVYLSHYKNLMYLFFIAKHPDTTYVERFQAEKELKICNRKLDYWKRNSEFNYDSVEAQVQQLKAQWS